MSEVNDLWKKSYKRIINAGMQCKKSHILNNIRQWEIVLPIQWTMNSSIFEIHDTWKYNLYTRSVCYIFWSFLHLIALWMNLVHEKSTQPFCLRKTSFFIYTSRNKFFCQSWAQRFNIFQNQVGIYSVIFNRYSFFPGTVDSVSKFKWISTSVLQMVGILL